ncbi:MAG: type II secretion system F family protein, partial [Gammaproteobacteria bacterium]
VEAMQSVAGASGNIVYTDGILKMRDEVSTGQQLNQAMRQSNLFPNMVVQMAAIGEESGSLDTMLSKVADFYEEEVDNQVDSLSSLLEPLIMVILGVLVGGLVVAMYLPIFKLGSVV